MAKEKHGWFQWTALLFCTVLLCGCIPLTPKSTSRHAYSKEALAFLALPDTTRSEVLSELGSPVAEVSDIGVLVYTWELTSRFLAMHPGGIDAYESVKQNDLVVEVDASKVQGPSQIWVLFVAFDPKGKIVGHQVSKLASGDLEKEARAWHRTLSAGR